MFIVTKLSFLALLLLSVGCSAESTKNECADPYIRIISSVLEDAELRDYANTHFGAAGEVIVIWETNSSPKRSCEIGDIRFTLTKSSELRKQPQKYVLVTKMYYDESAAFVEVALPPTGKNGDFFLRKHGRWNVMQRALWER